ncbi:MAG: heme biosynthesis HemY N-terminal domain-containing protein [bacterium]
MSRTLLILLGVALIGAIVVWVMTNDSGYLLIAVGHYSLEMSLWAALLFLVILWLVVKVIRVVVQSVKTGGKNLASADWFDRAGASRRQMGRGLIQFLEGRWAPAKKNLESSADHSDMPVLNLLAAATAAFEMGERAEADRLLENAANQSGQDLAVDLVRARLMVRQKQFAQAIAVLEKLLRKHPENQSVLSMLAESYQGNGDWQRLESLYPDMRRLKVSDKSEMTELQNQSAMALLKEYAARAAEEKGEKARDRFRDYWNELPASARKDSRVLKTYLHGLCTIGDGVKAESLLTKAINKDWDDELVRLYGIIESADSARQLVIAEGWLKDRPGNRELIIALARICQKNDLWGKARDYLERALSLGESADVYLDLAQVSARLGDNERSAQYYREGLLAVGHY